MVWTAQDGDLNAHVCSKTCLATVLIRSIFTREKLHEASARVQFFQRKIDRIKQ